MGAAGGAAGARRGRGVGAVWARRGTKWDSWDLWDYWEWLSRLGFRRGMGPFRSPHSEFPRFSHSLSDEFGSLRLNQLQQLMLGRGELLDSLFHQGSLQQGEVNQPTISSSTAAGGNWSTRRVNASSLWATAAFLLAGWFECRCRPARATYFQGKSRGPWSRCWRR